MLLLFALVCAQVCSGIHRSLGVHVSKVRSIVLDDLDTELLDMMVALGNTRANAIWEATVPKINAGAHGAPSSSPLSAAAAAAGGPHKPTPATPREEKEEFIIAKYVKRRFLSPALLAAADAASGSSTAAATSVPSGSPSASASASASSSAVSLLSGDERYSGWFKACENDDLEGLLTHLLQGCEVDWRNAEDGLKTALHHAAQHDAVLACEFLVRKKKTKSNT